MIFADNPTTIVIPFGKVSLFYKFYTLRNTDKPALKGTDTLEFSIIEDGDILFTQNFATKRLNFINHNYFLKDEKKKSAEIDYNSLKNIPSGFGKAFLRIISYKIELVPDLFVQFISNEIPYDDDSEIVHNKIAIVKIEDDTEVCIKNQKSNFINKIVIKSIMEYNKYLFDRLFEKELWNAFAKEREIDLDWIQENIFENNTINSVSYQRRQDVKVVTKIVEKVYNNLTKKQLNTKPHSPES